MPLVVLFSLGVRLMCGIAGILSDRPRSDLGALILPMTELLQPRGPDGSGTFIGTRLALGHRRLSVLDLSPLGSQPMSLASDDLVVVFNGEIYNFLQLRRELESIGHSFRGHSDTEVVLHCYQEWGARGLRRLEGIFAIALWDRAADRLLLMRDRLGVKPLFVARVDGMLLFASEIKSLLSAGVDRSIDRRALTEYLWFGNSFEERTIYSAVRALLPGHWMIVDGNGIKVEPYWRLEDWLAAGSFPGSEREGEQAVGVAIDAAVSRQLVADVPVGLLLSGGIDSSAIAAAAVRASPGRLSSYSIAFDYEDGEGELPKARKVARHLGLEHHEFRVTGSGLEDTLLALARAHDEPFADAANIPLFLLARELRGSVKVVLQGDGGDEVFAGYRRYAILRNLAYWRMCGLPGARSVLARSGRTGRRLERLIAATNASTSAERMALLLTTETHRESPLDLFEPGERRRLSSEPAFAAFSHCAERFGDHDVVRAMLLTDMCLQLPSQFLTKVDRSTMACGVEARVPLLDERVVQLGVSLPTNWLVRGTEKKRILRNSLRDRIPAEILNAPKAGFGVPYEKWIASSLRDFARERILEPTFTLEFGLDRARVERCFDEHVSSYRDRGFMLWKLLQLSLWSTECR